MTYSLGDGPTVEVLPEGREAEWSQWRGGQARSVSDYKVRGCRGRSTAPFCSGLRDLAASCPCISKRNHHRKVKDSREG